MLVNCPELYCNKWFELLDDHGRGNGLGVGRRRRALLLARNLILQPNNIFLLLDEASCLVG